MNTKSVLLTLELIRPKILTELTKGLSVLEGGGPQIGEVTRSGGVKKKMPLHEIFQPHQLGVPFPEFLIISMFAKREHLVVVTLSQNKELNWIISNMTKE